MKVIIKKGKNSSPGIKWVAENVIVITMVVNNEKSAWDKKKLSP